MFWNRSKTDDSALAQRVIELETQVRLLRVEWDEVYDKMSNALARQRKRDRDAEKTPEEPEPVPGPARKAALWRSAQHLLNGRGNVRG